MTQALPPAARRGLIAEAVNVCGPTSKARLEALVNKGHTTIDALLQQYFATQDSQAEPIDLTKNNPHDELQVATARSLEDAFSAASKPPPPPGTDAALQAAMEASLAEAKADR
jgi:hypothetical protein